MSEIKENQIHQGIQLSVVMIQISINIIKLTWNIIENLDIELDGNTIAAKSMLIFIPLH